MFTINRQTALVAFTLIALPLPAQSVEQGIRLFDARKYLEARAVLLPHGGGSKQKAREMMLEIKKRNAYRGSLSAASLCTGEKDFACAERELTGMLTTYPDQGSRITSVNHHQARET